MHPQSTGSNLYGDSAGTSTNSYGQTGPVHAICVTPP